MVVALTLVAVAGQQGVQVLLTQTAWPTGDAQWIWQAERHRQTAPWAFWAVKDFRWPATPEAGSGGEARDGTRDGPQVLIQADPSYLLYVNGRRVGSNLYHPGAELDAYPVADLLRPGANRLAVLVRSGWGAGGLLAALVDGDGRPRVVTDGSWRLLARAHPGILGGWLPAAEGEPAMAWGPPPVGRWGWLGEPVPRPSFSAVTGPPWQRRPQPPRRLATGPAVLAGDGRQLPWRPVSPQRLQAPGDGDPLGPAVLLDWGRPVTGYLALDHSRQAGRPAGLLKVGMEPPRALGVGAQDVVEVISVPGAAGWRDAVPRTFRYALVLGADSLVGAWVEPVAEDHLAALPSPPPPVTGVFGVEPPPLETPVEHEVRRKLKGLADRAGGEVF